MTYLSSHTTTRWWWIRHAQVTENQGRVYGSDDYPCDISDKASFAGLAKLLPTPAELITSGMLRARMTADAICEAGWQPNSRQAFTELNEQGFGNWQGRHYHDVYKELQNIARYYWPCPAYFRPEGGESFLDLVARAAPCIERLSEDHKGKDVVCVAHGGIVRAALLVALGLEAERALTFDIDNLSITRIDYRHIDDHIRWSVKLVNRPPRDDLEIGRGD